MTLCLPDLGAMQLDISCDSSELKVSTDARGSIGARTRQIFYSKSVKVLARHNSFESSSGSSRSSSGSIQRSQNSTPATKPASSPPTPLDCLERDQSHAASSDSPPIEGPLDDALCASSRHMEVEASTYTDDAHASLQ